MLYYHAGSVDKKDYMILPGDNLHEKAPAVLKMLNDDLKCIRAISYEWQQALVSKRDNSQETLNKYQPGDYVLYFYSVVNERANKLDTQFLGPYIVLSHVHNEVSVRNLITDAVSTFHCTRVKLFVGTSAEAQEAALRDADQYYIDSFLAYKGNPEVRTTVIFYIKFADGCVHWMPWSKDLYDTEQYESYCNSKPELAPLTVMLKESLILKKLTNNTPIAAVEPGMHVYMDLRAIGAGLYEFLNLPDFDFALYVVVLEYMSWQDARHTRINCVIPSLDIRWSGRSAVSHSFVKWWGSTKEVSEKMIVINNAFIRQYNIIDIIKNND
jgi:hypothetical protein